MNIDYAAVLLIFLVAAFLGVVMILMTTYLGPKKPNPEKDKAFECGSGLPLSRVQRNWPEDSQYGGQHIGSPLSRLLLGLLLHRSFG